MVLEQMIRSAAAMSGSVWSEALGGAHVYGLDTREFPELLRAHFQQKSSKRLPTGFQLRMSKPAQVFVIGPEGHGGGLALFCDPPNAMPDFNQGVPFLLSAELSAANFGAHAQGMDTNTRGNVVTYAGVLRNVKQVRWDRLTFDIVTTERVEIDPAGEIAAKLSGVAVTTARYNSECKVNRYDDLLTSALFFAQYLSEIAPLQS